VFKDISFLGWFLFSKTYKYTKRSFCVNHTIKSLKNIKKSYRLIFPHKSKKQCSFWHAFWDLIINLLNPLGINNEGHRVFEVKVIPIIDGFAYDEAIILSTYRYDFSLGAKIKSQYLLLRPRILHKIIAYCQKKKKHYNEVTFMDICIIDYMIRSRPINISYIMMRNLIMACDQKKKSLPYGKCLTTIFEHFKILLTCTNKTFVINENNVWVYRD
jgi:hypothetical protein